MYQAKRAGGGVRLYDQADDPHDESQLDLLSQLRAAIDDDQLRLHFQPRVGLRTGRTVGFEALVRWAHPDRGLLPPGTFVPLAERTALMHPLTDWVLRAAIRECARWRSAGRDVGVAVNIPPATLLDAELPARMTELLTRERLPGHALELEITETAVMVDPERWPRRSRRSALQRAAGHREPGVPRVAVQWLDGHVDHRVLAQVDRGRQRQRHVAPAADDAEGHEVLHRLVEQPDLVEAVLRVGGGEVDLQHERAVVALDHPRLAGGVAVAERVQRGGGHGQAVVAPRAEGHRAGSDADAHDQGRRGGEQQP
jgi:hypothetical protein